MAEEVDGAIVKPGDTFSLNGYTGPRTAAQGYVEAGVIKDGAPSREVGGGISQFATTLYNASYFAAMTDAGHKEHSYYISRYPAAREATVFQNHDGSSVIDLKFTNDSTTGVAIQTIWTPDSITVKIWGTKHYDVESVTGDRTDFTKPETKRAGGELPRRNGARASPRPTPASRRGPARRSAARPARSATTRTPRSSAASRRPDTATPADPGPCRRQTSAGESDAARTTATATRPGREPDPVRVVPAPKADENVADRAPTREDVNRGL